MILLIDNYDSFSYNVYQLVGKITQNMKVIRNDEMTAEQIKVMAPSAIILSPGPGRPENAGICEDVVKNVNVPILGICLGHQAICHALGGSVGYAKELMHGKQSVISVDTQSKLFKGMDKEIKAARYHSLCADRLPEEMRVTAKTADGEIMAAEHKTKPIYGVQFHPESVLTPDGEKIIRNFLDGII